jgi:hypothetical protein
MSKFYVELDKDMTRDEISTLVDVATRIGPPYQGYKTFSGVIKDKLAVHLALLKKPSPIKLKFTLYESDDEPFAGKYNLLSLQSDGTYVVVMEIAEIQNKLVFRPTGSESPSQVKNMIHNLLLDAIHTTTKWIFRKFEDGKEAVVMVVPPSIKISRSSKSIELIQNGFGIGVSPLDTDNICRYCVKNVQGNCRLSQGYTCNVGVHTHFDDLSPQLQTEAMYLIIHEENRYYERNHRVTTEYSHDN